MTRNFRFFLILLAAWVCELSLAHSFTGIGRAYAQDSSRSSRSDGESREERRDRYRRGGFFGDRGSSDRGSSDRGSSDRGRDSRGSRSRDEERRNEERSSSGSGSTSSNSASSTSRSGSTSTSTPSATTPTPAPQSSTSGPNMKEYAVKLVKQYDKNNDNMLQPEERKELRGPAADSDLNHDGTITIDELVAHLSNPSPTTATAASGTDSPTNGTSNSSGSSGDRDRGGYGYRRRDGDSGSDRGKSDADKALAGRVFTGTAGGSAASTKEGDKRRTYRFTRPADRLPATLPSWFKSRDTNGDGQVSMSEYSRSWSTSSVSEFRRYDQNDDGIITAKEAAKKP